MQKILIFNQIGSNAGAYGIGSFVRLFKYVFNRKDYDVYFIELHSAVKELSVKSQQGITTIQIPSTSAITESAVMDLLQLHCKDLNGCIAFFNYSSQFKIAEQMRKKELNIYTIAIVHAFSWVWGLKGDEAKLAKYVKKRGANDEGAKYVYDYFLDEQKGLNMPHKIVVLSDDSFNLLHSVYKIDSDRLALILNGIKDRYKPLSVEDIATLRAELHVNSDEKIILYTGRLDDMKGVGALIAAFNRVVKQNNSCRLVIVGDGNFKSVSTNIGEAATKITFTGRISYDQVEKWYSIADIGVLPSLSEECSFVAIEMMMYGLPIISTNGRGVRNMFIDNENSLVVDCKSGFDKLTGEIFEAILKLLEDQNLLHKLKNGARKFYLTKYQFIQMKEMYNNLVKEIIAGR